MTDLVVDCCIVTKWLVNEIDTPAARRIHHLYLAGGVRLLTPDLICPETSHVLWKKVRRGDITAAEARNAFEEFLEFNFFITPSSELAQEAMRIALDHGHSPYDCLYVALSQQAVCPLVTADEAMVRRLGAAYPNLTLLSAWPTAP